MPSPSPAPTDPDAPLITEEADRLLGRIILRYGALTFVLLVLVSFVMVFVNIPGGRLFPERRFLDTLSILVIMLPFFLGINRLFAARLRIGRDLVRQRLWRPAVAALDPFAGPTQRFLDTTGEAHYLLTQAYAGAGEQAKAEAARAFVLRHRPGPWAEKLRSAETGPKIRPHAVKSKRRRRF